MPLEMNSKVMLWSLSLSEETLSSTLCICMHPKLVFRLLAGTKELLQGGSEGSLG